MDTESRALGQDGHPVSQQAMGYHLAQVAGLPEYLARHRVPDVLATQLWMYIGAFAQRELSCTELHEICEGIEIAYMMPSYQLSGLVDVTLRRNRHSMSLKSLNFLKKHIAGFHETY